MTTPTREDLVREREALTRLRAWVDNRSWLTEVEDAALTASIARVDALLSLSDDECLALAGMFDAGAQQFGGLDRAFKVYRTVADIVRRTS